MKTLNQYLADINNQNRKALSVFLTAGFPDPDHFVTLCLRILDAGADMLEIGIPFSDPIADGPVIQKSSYRALQYGITLSKIFDFVTQLRAETEKPLILMGYANPIQRYGTQRFCEDAVAAGVQGIIIPDIPLEEYDDFWEAPTPSLARILLTTPTSPAERIERIDQLSEGFVYCVSVTGTTGMQQGFSASVQNNLHRTYTQIKKNKMLIGFGISSADDIRTFAPFCDGVIVGSAVIHRLLSASGANFQDTCDFVSGLSAACRF
jgi:tryptophan synthase alpha chain